MSYQHQYIDGTPIHFPLGKLVCVGRNYAEHAKELNNPVPTEPLLFIKPGGTVAKLAMRQPFVLFKGLTFQKLCLPGAFRPGDHHNKMLRPGLCVVHASPQYL
ncbi:paraquat-inducible protein B [Pseudomonas aeruginosa NCGM2.S1]|nr:paraquat-inducible protein B [Pseudomonas aeruginosa NCGM2.S1]